MRAWRDPQTVLGIGLIVLALMCVLLVTHRDPAKDRPAFAKHGIGMDRPGEAQLPAKSGSRSPSKSSSRQRLVDSGQITLTADDGWLIREAPLHELFQLLANQAGLDYDHKQHIEGDE